jgi:type IV secretory pathway TrbF-like protein
MLHRLFDREEGAFPMFEVENRPQMPPPTETRYGQPATRSRGWVWVVVGLLLLSCLISTIQVAVGLGQTLRPFARPIFAADQYYTAIKNHDYAQAYTYLDASLTSTLSRDQFVAQAQSRDSSAGMVTSFSLAPDFTTDPAQNLTVTVTRADRTTYTVHLQVHQVGQSWKIIAFDGI